jgi:signal transduction histidine kinase
VRDSGPGFTPQALANLFVPFHTTKSGGTGLGLPISQRIVENHRGLIEASAPEGGGAQFTVVLPIEPQPRAAAPLP